MRFLGRIKRLCHDQSGLTLIDLAVVLMVIGLLAVPAVKAYENWREKKFIEDTKGDIGALKTAIDDFYFAFNRYPCPADPRLGPGDAGYGTELCANGGFTDVGANIMQGSIPFDALKIPSSMTIDEWGRKIVYAVTKQHTIAVNVAGVLSTQRVNCADGTLDAPVPDGHYIFFSAGDLGIGSYPAGASALPVQACPAGGAATRESENCDNDALFTLSTCARSFGPNLNYYDDITPNTIPTTVPSRIWNFAEDDPSNIFSNAGNIGVNNPGAMRELDVAGNIRADNDAISDYICDTNGNNCYQVRAFSEVVGDMNSCNTSNSAVSGITSGTNPAGVRARCVNAYPIAIPHLCAGTSYVIGIDAGGNVQCSP